MTIASNLESGRVQELDRLLQLVVPKIVAHVARADPRLPHYDAAALGTFHAPLELKAQLLTPPLALALASDGIGGRGKSPEDAGALNEVIDKVLNLLVNTWSPGFLDKLYALNNPIGVVSDLILLVLNTNLHVYTVSPVLSVLENYVGRQYARLFFDRPEQANKCGGLTFLGGSWSNVTLMQIARALKVPETKQHGNAGHRFAVYTLKHSHYSVEKAAILLGLGSASVFKIAINAEGEMDVAALERTIVETRDNGYTPLYVNATAGTTVFGLYDPFEAIADVAKRHGVWFHIDGLWGANVVFLQTHRRKLQGCHLADSITTNPHKMLGVPTTCSFLLLPHVGHFQQAMSLLAPYLFHDNFDEEENYDLADGTMGCGRRADSFKFYMAWLYYGSAGFAHRVDHAFAIARYFIERVSATEGFEVVLGSADRPPACLQVCFYYRPAGYTEVDCTRATRFISRSLHAQGKYLVDYSPNTTSSDGKGEFFRVVFNSPILTDAVVDDLVASIVAAGKTLP